jgi:NADH-quinone oxidoreductase subunit C
MLTNTTIKASLDARFPNMLSDWDEQFGLLTVTAPKDRIVDLLTFLKTDEALQFNFLTDLCAVHYPQGQARELAVVYHLHNLVANVRIRVKVYTDANEALVPTATTVFPGANWMERETYDFFGVNFVGHPNLIRILNVDEMDYFPLRKQYPLEDQSRIDKDDAMFGRGGSYN